MDTSSINLISIAITALPLLVTTGVVVGGLFLARALLIGGEKRMGERREGLLGRQATMLLLTLIGAVAIILSLPVDDQDQRQLLSLLGLLLSGAIALASTSFLGNIMAGLMLRAVGSIRTGDLVVIGEKLGRVSERGLFHVEMQSEDRELTTFSNMYLTANPVRVVGRTDALVTARVSIGYDNHHDRIQELLKEAAVAAGLGDPFVRILELGDFAVSYQVAGLLEDTATLLTARSRLNARILDTLHGADVEIMTPNVMSQRPLEPQAAVIPERTLPSADAPDDDATADRVTFDKADAAVLRERLEDLRSGIEQSLEALKSTDDPAERRRLEAALERVERALAVEDESS